MSISDVSYLTNIKPAVHPIHVELPNGTYLHSTHTAMLDLPMLPTAARTAHVFPGMTTGSLLSIGMLCDHGCDEAYGDYQK